MECKQEKQPCPICLEEYVSEKRPYRVFECTHTFCNSCFFNLLEYTLMCPTCYEHDVESIVKSPTNLNSKLKLLQEQTENQTLKLTEAFQKIEGLNTKLQYCSNILNYWSLLNDEDDPENAPEETDKDDHELVWKILEAEDIIKNMDLTFNSCFNSKLMPDFSLSSCYTKEEFLSRIVVELYKKKDVYALHSEWWNSTVYWAKLGFKDGKLYIYTFTSETPTNPFLFALHGDLKKCMSADNFYTFIDVFKQIFTCKILTSSESTLKFIKLCSGEDGESLKSLKGAKRRINATEGFNEIIFDIDSNKNEPEKRDYISDYQFLQSLHLFSMKAFKNKWQIRMIKGEVKFLKLVMGENATNFVKDDTLEIIGVAEHIQLDFTGSHQYQLLDGEPYFTVENCGLFIKLRISK